MINEDSLKLYNTILKEENKNPWNIYDLANNLNKLERINYRTADLLERHKAFVLNKENNSIENVNIIKTDSDRKFQISDTTILYVIDRFY